jgi:AraC family transcriptional regulator of adaptative response/methylated-DNA-[protein]-cysteine methyltransferase
VERVEGSLWPSTLLTIAGFGYLPPGLCVAEQRKIRVEVQAKICYIGCMMNRELSQQANDYQRVAQAIRFLEGNYRAQPSLDEMAGSVHLSKYHFQRLFKRWAGISPTKFLQYLTIGYAKERLQESKSVLDAALDAGLSGPSRLHDLFVTFEATTPGEYRRQGEGLEIAYGFHDSPFGTCLLATTQRGICGLQFVDADDTLRALQTLRERWPHGRFVDKPEETQAIVDRIFAPVAGDRSRPFHLLLKGTNFQVNVWQALLNIPPGGMASYGDVATYLDKPGASRAVASAIAHNPVGYLIPCHRVISSTGKIHGYQWGVARKKAMLGLEASRRHLKETSESC